MYAMQYEITLPADYDMGIIRQRVATRGHLLDDFPGLAFKAYLMRERGKDGSHRNQYAPFYLWTEVEAMGRFLWGGGGFAGLIDSFGRPAVRHWTGVACFAGPARRTVPRAAIRRRLSISAEQNLVTAAARGRDFVERQACEKGAHSAVFAIDPHRWESLVFVLAEELPENVLGDSVIYEVLHLSSPHFDEIAGQPSAQAEAAVRRQEASLAALYPAAPTRRRRQTAPPSSPSDERG
jgi:hypothetical protein